MGTNSIYINIFYGLIAIALFTGCFSVKPKTTGWAIHMIVIVLFIIGGVIIHSYFLAFSAVLAGVVSVYLLRKHFHRTRQVELILIHDTDDRYLHHFLSYYQQDILKFFPGFDFKIEEEFIVALVVSKMETVGLLIAEIKSAETLRIRVDYLIPKYRQSQLAKTFYHCKLRCIDFLGYRYMYIEPQSKAHNDYLEKIGFKLVDGKYINQCFNK